MRGLTRYIIRNHVAFESMRDNDKCEYFVGRQYAGQAWQ
jgi:hypothetical protein